MNDFVMGAKLTLRDEFSSQVKKVRQASEDLDRTTKRVTANTRLWTTANGKLGASFGLIQRGIAAATAAFGLYKAKSWLIDANADMETYQNTLQVVLGSEEAAVKTLAWAQKFAAKTPFEIPQIVEATTRMSAYGINAEKTLGIVGDMASVMGKDLMQAVEAVADAQTGEMERLKEFGITKKMINEQAKLLQVTVTNNKGQITDQKAFNAVLFSLMEKRFKGGMELQSKTFKGMLSNAKDFVGQTGRELGKPLFDKLKTQLSEALDYFQKLKDEGKIDQWIKEIQDSVGSAAKFVKDNWGTIKTTLEGVAGALLLVKTYQILYTAALKAGLIIQTISAAWGYATTVLALMREGTSLAAIAQMELNLAMKANPVGFVITVLMALVGVIVLVATHWDKITAAVKKAWNWFTNLIKGMPDVALALTGPLAPLLLLIKHFKEVKDAVGGAFKAVKKFFGIGEGGGNDPGGAGRAGQRPGRNAYGTSNWRGGPTWVGERGPEIIDAPGGSSIYSNNDIAKAVNPAGNTGRGITKTTHIAKLFDNLVIQGADGMDEEALADKVVNKMYDKLKAADDIATDDMGGLL